MGFLWRGGWGARLRVVAAFVLSAVALSALAGLALGLVATPPMERALAGLAGPVRFPPFGILIALAALIHFGHLIGTLAVRRTFRIGAVPLIHLLTGLTVPVLLIPVLFEVLIAPAWLGAADTGLYLVARFGEPWRGGALALLLVTATLHWGSGLRIRFGHHPGWPAFLPWLAGAASLAPALALAGLAAAVSRLGAEPALAELRTRRWTATADQATSDRLALIAVAAFLALVLAAFLINVLRRSASLRRRVEVNFVDGPKVTGPHGMTIHEIALVNDVPHVALCGGAARCTTCRVIVERGEANLIAPEAPELAMLAEIGSPKHTRLACQAIPTGPVSVFRVYDVKRGRARAHASTGVERRMVILFLDMRGFTARASGKPPYDVVYMLNRFFDVVIPAVTERGGRIDKYLGDGFLAVFDLDGGPGPSSRAALGAVVAMDAALTRVNATLAQEGEPPLKIGVGLHLGELVQGEIGALGNAPVTVIGDAVNTAARLEGMTKLLSAQVLVSRPVLEAAGVTVPEIGWQRLDLRGVAGGVQALPLRSGAELLPFLASAPRATG